MDKKGSKRNLFMLYGPLSKKGYDWWWHNFTAENEKTGEKKHFILNTFYVTHIMQKKNQLLYGIIKTCKIRE